MQISKLFEKGKTKLSYEVFPPKKTSSIETIYPTLDALGELKPDFISVTYGAGGSVANTLTRDISSMIKNKYGIEAIAHLTCINTSKDDVDIILDGLKEAGIENILALRGDINPEIPRKYDFEYASDLVKYIKDRGDFYISGACYPEVHIESESMEKDIENLKIKVDAGVEHLISQLFFENSKFYNFMDHIRKAGINVPVEAGIMPVTNKRQIERMVSMCGASLPAKFVKVMQRYENNPEALRDAGIAYAAEQIIDLAANGVDGIHLYTMNNPYVARKITESVKNIIKA
ncbi:MAG: methylenetetrahydrofolate reductase [NAD(P)H] [Eubacterium sp.]